MYSLLLDGGCSMFCFLPGDSSRNNIKTNYEGACSMDPQSIIIYILYC